MKKLKKFMRNDRGAVQMIEAAILYPIVFMLIIVLIYIGLYIFQSMSVGAYAQKAAILAAREVAHPMYINEIDNDVFNTVAVEGDLGDGTSFNGSGKLHIETKAKNIKKTRAYRYWSSDPISSYKDPYEAILKEMIASGSILGTKGDVTVEIKGENKIIVQYITVTVKQPVLDFPFLDFFNIKTPTVSASALTTVNDIDELVRNTDFAADTISTLARKLGIDVDKIGEKFKTIKSDLGLD